MFQKRLAIKIDVDTDRGTRIGVPQLLKVFKDLNIFATFLFSLGPDNTGKAIKRIFRPGFLKKVNRSGVIGMYGLRTLLNGTVLPAPHIGQRNEVIMRQVFEAGHEVGIHCYDHIFWQDYLESMTLTKVREEFLKAYTEFKRIFKFPAKTAGAAGWKANAFSLKVYDEASLLYASDVRGVSPFFPRINQHIYETLQIPTNLPTLDELIGRPEFPLHQLIKYYSNCLLLDRENILTIHAEIEGMKYKEWFKSFLLELKSQNVQFFKLEDIAMKYLENSTTIPVCDLIQGEIDGRSGKLTLQEVN